MNDSSASEHAMIDQFLFQSIDTIDNMTLQLADGSSVSTRAGYVDVQIVEHIAAFDTCLLCTITQISHPVMLGD